MSILNSHTTIEFKMNKIASINVKRFSKNKTELACRSYKKALRFLKIYKNFKKRKN